MDAAADGVSVAAGGVIVPRESEGIPVVAGAVEVPPGAGADAADGVSCGIPVRFCAMSAVNPFVCGPRIRNARIFSGGDMAKKSTRVLSAVNPRMVAIVPRTFFMVPYYHIAGRLSAVHPRESCGEVGSALRRIWIVV